MIALLCVALAGVDVNQVQPLDGGPWPLLKEADTGQPWTAAAAVSWTSARNLLVLVDPPSRTVLVGDAHTREIGASLNFGGIGRLGVALPVHTRATLDGDERRNLRGDTALWAVVPLRQQADGDLALWVQGDLPTGADGWFLGDPGGGVSTTLAGARDFGPVAAALNVGARFQQKEELPGLTWGHRSQLGLGLRTGRVGPLSLATELQTSGPLAFWREAPPEAWPAEAVATVDLALPWGIDLQVGGGTGLGRGLGSPSSRLLAMVDIRPRDRGDADGDGIVDPRDFCRLVPEDLDGFHDWDGCPDEDNDDDGLLDDADVCRDVPETYNDYRDDDGCPDHVTDVHLVVTSDRPELLDTARVHIAGLDAFQVIGGDGVARSVPGEGPVLMTVQAPDHHDGTQILRLDDRTEQMVHVQLKAVQYGEVQLRVVGPDGPLAARLQRPRADGARAVPGEGLSLSVPAGPTRWTVDARGHLPREIDLDVPRGGVLQLEVALEPQVVWVEDRRIEVRDEVRFGLDSAALPDGAEDALDPLADWMIDNPAVELVRVEGHADELGGSRYNYDLSMQRAQSVIDHLVRRGVARERLVAVGAGEALADDAGSRKVGFLVLVWSDRF